MGRTCAAVDGAVDVAEAGGQNLDLLVLVAGVDVGGLGGLHVARHHRVPQRHHLGARSGCQALEVYQALRDLHACMQFEHMHVALELCWHNSR